MAGSVVMFFSLELTNNVFYFERSFLNLFLDFFSTVTRQERSFYTTVGLTSQFQINPTLSGKNDLQNVTIQNDQRLNDVFAQ